VVVRVWPCFLDYSLKKKNVIFLRKIFEV
jgi:hypothetical protein